LGAVILAFISVARDDLQIIKKGRFCSGID